MPARLNLLKESVRANYFFWQPAVQTFVADSSRPHSSGMGPQQLRASVPLAQAEDITVEAMQEHVARAAGLPARRQFLVVAEERARSASLGHLAKRMQVCRAPASQP